MIMTYDSTNPFVHPAQQRLLDLIDEAERELMEEQDETQPSHDPLQRFHMAREWGVEPWVAAMLPVSPDLSTLQDQASSFTPDTDLARKALMAVIKQSLQALVLLEEYEDGELMALDDGQLVDFLQHLMNKLDNRIGRLRRPEEGQIQDEDEDDHTDHVHWVPKNDPWSTQAVKQRTEEFLDGTSEPPPSPEEPPPGLVVNQKGDLEDPDVQPGLAFTKPYPATVAGEGPVQDPPLSTPPKNTPRHPMADVRELPNQGWDPDNLPVLEEDAPSAKIDWQPRLVPDEVEVKEKRRPPMSEAPFYGGDIGPATHVPEKPVDLDAAERALARETAQLRQSAAGSSATQLGGRHASPDDTLDDQGETGRRAKED